MVAEVECMAVVEEDGVMEVTEETMAVVEEDQIKANLVNMPE